MTICPFYHGSPLFTEPAISLVKHKPRHNLNPHSFPIFPGLVCVYNLEKEMLLLCGLSPSHVRPLRSRTQPSAGSWLQGDRPPAAAAPGALPWHPVPGPTLALLAGNGPAKERTGRVSRTRAGGLSRPPGTGEGGKRAERRQPCPRSHRASGAARDRWRRGPENPQLRDAPRPGQLEEQLCVRCGGVRIFALAFGGLAGCLRFPRQGKRFRPVY